MDLGTRRVEKNEGRTRNQMQIINTQMQTKIQHGFLLLLSLFQELFRIFLHSHLFDPPTFLSKKTPRFRHNEPNINFPTYILLMLG